MALTKTEAAKLSNDMLLRGVIDTIVKDSPILQILPFMQVVGTSVTYNRETTNPAATFYAVGDTWTEATPTFSTQTATLSILGGDADVDNFLQQTYADTNDLEAEVIAKRAKAVAHAFTSTFYDGDTIATPKSFDGIHVLIPSGQTISAGTNGAALTLDMVDELCDKTHGKPDVLLMSKRTRRALKKLRRGDAISTETQLNEFGQQVQTYDGIPILVDDFIVNTRAQGSGSNLSTMYALKFGMGEGVMGLENNGIQIETIGELETKDATRTRIKWYAGLALFNELGAAKLTGITA